MTSTPRANIVRESAKQCRELPKIMGIIGESLLVPVFNPRCLHKSRNKAEFSRKRTSRCGSYMSKRMAAKAAAAAGGEIPVAKTKPGMV